MSVLGGFYESDLKVVCVTSNHFSLAASNDKRVLEKVVSSSTVTYSSTTCKVRGNSKRAEQIY